MESRWAELRRGGKKPFWVADNSKTAVACGGPEGKPILAWANREGEKPNKVKKVSSRIMPVWSWFRG